LKDKCWYTNVLWQQANVFLLEKWMAGVGMSLYYCFHKSRVVRMVETMQTPLRGGLEYMGQTTIFNSDSTLLASSTSLQITVKTPTHSPYKPTFLTYDWQRQTLMPCSMKWHTAQASLLSSPLAKPW
uniref:Uncharacterized protein n=1 Tax=Prolemur simus TaxID=1328070 RepID=A0A8C8YXG1_PROSS